MQMIDARRVHELLDYPGLIAAIRKAHLGGMPKLADRHIYQELNGSGHPDSFIILPAWQPREGILAKLVTSFPRNKAEFDRPTVNSLYVFMNGETGIAEAVIDGESMIFRKTSADSALGADLLARKEIHTMLMIGAGGLAPYLVRAHCSVRPSIERVLIWNRTESAAVNLANMLRGEHIPASVVSDLPQALSEADLISSATMATVPHVLGDRLRPGAHIDLVGSFTPEMREADDATLKRSAIYVDHRQTTERSGEFIGPFARNVISSADVRGDLFELCQGRVAGRTSDTQITLMKNGGGSHIDYYVAKYLIDRLNGRSFETACAS
jgi:ornithine cyclodeaminase